MKNRACGIVFTSFVALGIGCASTSVGATGAAPDARDGRADAVAPVVPESGADAGAVASQAKAQMNDLSVLFPLVGAVSDYIGADTVGADGPFLPAWAWAAAGGDEVPSAQGGGMVPQRFAELRLVAFRFDPCFAQIGAVVEGTVCENQLRMTFQPLSGTVGELRAADSGVHVFYSLSRAEFVAAVRGMIAARIASAGDEKFGALAPHPLMARQGMGGQYTAAVTAVLKTYARSSRLVRIARFNATDPNVALTWRFRGFDFQGVAASPMHIPKLAVAAGEDDTVVAVNTAFGGGGDVDGTFTPASSSPDALDLLLSGAGMRAAEAAKRQAVFDAAMRVENPGRHSPATIDCATCHMGDFLSESATQRFGIVRNGNTHVYVPDSAQVSPTDMKRYVAPGGAQDAGVANLHMFSYFHAVPGIAQRVVNETAEVMAYVNGTLLK